MLNKMNIKKRLVCGFSFVTLLFIVLLIFYNYINSSVIKTYEFTIKNMTGGAFLMYDAKLQLDQVALNTKNFQLDGNIRWLEQEKGSLQKLIDNVSQVKIFATVNSGRKDLIPVFASLQAKYDRYTTQLNRVIAATPQRENNPESFQQLLDEKNALLLTFDEELQPILEGAFHDQKLFLERNHSTAQKLAKMAFLITAVVIILAIGMGIFISLGISRPLGRATTFAHTIAKGDFTSTLTLEREDEIGMLCASLGLMQRNLIQMISQLKHTASDLSTSSTSLTEISTEMAHNSESSSQMATAVHNASEQMSTNINIVSKTMEEAAMNASMVASASEQMSATINEIAHNAERGRNVVEGAVHKSSRASDRMNALGKAAQAINQVTETISEISEQTNLLALNATIEAARAGEAGKGFAVVANEIKELARQTSEATGNIKQQIQDVQQTALASVEEINEVAEVIGEINTIVATIATAVEEQSAATREIVGNINQTSSGIQEVNENIGQSSAAVDSIASNIKQVTARVHDVAKAGGQVSLSADELNQLSRRLNDLINEFHL